MNGLALYDCLRIMLTVPSYQVCLTLAFVNNQDVSHLTRAYTRTGTRTRERTSLVPRLLVWGREYERTRVQWAVNGENVRQATCTRMLFHVLAALMKPSSAQYKIKRKGQIGCDKNVLAIVNYCLLSRWTGMLSACRVHPAH